MFRVWLSTIYSLVLGLLVEEGLVEAYKVSVWGCMHREVHMLDGCARGSRSGDGCFSSQLFDHSHNIDTIQESGDRGLPCQTPSSILNHLDCCSSTWTLACNVCVDAILFRISHYLSAPVYESRFMPLSPVTCSSHTGTCLWILHNL